MSDIQAGPCAICGTRNYSLSFGGPTICPSCDCGNFGQRVVERQRDRILELERELSTRTEALPSGDGMSAGRFHCACVFSRPTDFSEAVLVEECSYHSSKRREPQHGAKE